MKRILLLLCWFIWLSGVSFGAIAVVDGPTTMIDNTNNVASSTFSFTCTTGAALMTVQHHMYELGNTISSMSYNSGALSVGVKRTQFASTQQESTEIWYIINPSCDGSPHNLVVNYSPNRSFEGRVGITTWSGTATSSVIGVTGETFTQGSGSSSPDSISMSMTSGSVAVDGVTVSAAPTVGGSATQMYNTTVGGSNAAGSYLLDATAMSWTFSGTARISHVAMEIKASGGGGGGTTVRHRVVTQ